MIVRLRGGRSSKQSRATASNAQGQKSTYVHALTRGGCLRGASLALKGVLQRVFMISLLFDYIHEVHVHRYINFRTRRRKKRLHTSDKRQQTAAERLLLVPAWCLPLIDQGFAALILHDVLHALAEGVRLAIPSRRVEAGVPWSGVYARDQP